MEGALLIIKAIIFAKLITDFSPISWIVDGLPENTIKWILQVLTGCLKCATFWITIILTGDLFHAAVAYIAANVWYSVEKIIKNTWRKLEKKTI